MREISGIFFSTLAEKKKHSIISHREKNPGLFFRKIVDFRQKKNSVIFLNYRPPYFCQNCELQMKKLKSHFGQNWGSQTEIKKYRLISVKTVYFGGNKKIPIIFAKIVKKLCRKKKKYRDPRKGVSECLQYLFQGKKKYDTFGLRDLEKKNLLIGSGQKREI